MEGNNPHGIAWGPIQSILSLRGVREFTIENLHICARRFPDDDFTAISPPPLTAFRHRMTVAPTRPDLFTSETEALSAILSKTHRTLETLHLFGASAPISLLIDLEWPRLKELVFHDRPWESINLHPITSLTRMSRLRTLILKFSVPRDAVHTQREPLWPRGYAGPFPWPELERLVVTCPNVYDELYDHLPSTVRSLSLRYWKHVWWYERHFEKGEDIPDYSLLITATSLLEILRRCRLPDLVSLEIEYMEDEKEEELFTHIAASFPHLTYLKLVRYQEDRRNLNMPTVSLRICDWAAIDLTLRLPRA